MNKPRIYRADPPSSDAPYAYLGPAYWVFVMDIRGTPIYGYRSTWAGALAAVLARCQTLKDSGWTP